MKPNIVSSLIASMSHTAAVIEDGGSRKLPTESKEVMVGGTRVCLRPEPMGRGYQACVDGDWKRWDRGVTEAAAIHNLRLTWNF